MNEQDITSVIAAVRVFNGLDGPGFESQTEHEIFSYPGPSTPALGLTPPPI